MDVTAIIVAVLGVLGGGGLTALVLGLRKQSMQDTGDVNEFLNKQYTLAVAEIAKFMGRLNTIERAILDLQRTHYEQPLPTWTKNMFGQYTWYNDMASRMIFARVGMNADAVIGKTDDDVWGVELADVLRNLNKQALLAPDRRARQSGIRLHPDLPTFTIYTSIADTHDPSHPIAYTQVAIDEI